MDVSFSRVCPVIDNEFRHNIVKVVCGSTRLSPLWIHSYFDNIMTNFMINNRNDAWKTDVHLLTSSLTLRQQQEKNVLNLGGKNRSKLHWLSSESWAATYGGHMMELQPRKTEGSLF